MASNEITIDFENMQGTPKDEILQYENNFKNELSNITDIVNTYLKDEINKASITDRNKWTFQHVIPNSDRSGAKVDLNVGRDENISKKSFLHIKGNESLFGYMNHKIDEAIKNAPKSKVKELKDLKDYVNLLQIQAMSKIAEVGAQNALQNFSASIKSMNEKHQIKNRKVMDAMENSLVALEALYAAYSLDFLKDGTIDRYTSNQAGELRKAVKEHTNGIKDILNYYEAQGLLSVNEKKALLNQLNEANSCFEHKNNLSFNVPTAGQTTTQKVRKGGQVVLGVTGVVLGVAATGVAIATTGPLGVAAGAALGGGALLAGVGSLGVTAINSANNFIRYRMPPSKGEKLTFAIAGISLGVGVGSSVASSLVAGNQLATLAVTGTKQVCSSSKSGLTLVGGLKTIKTVKSSEKNADFCNKSSPQDSIKQNLQDSRKDDTQQVQVPDNFKPN